MTELTLNQSCKLCEGMESESLKMPSEEMSSSVSQPFLLHTLDGDSNDHSCCVCGKFSSCLGSSAEETVDTDRRGETERHFCGKICSGLLAQTLTFVQGFLLGNFLCIIHHSDSVCSHGQVQSFCVTNEKNVQSLCVKEEPVPNVLSPAASVSLTSNHREPQEPVSILKLEHSLSVRPLAVLHKAKDASVETHQHKFQCNYRSRGEPRRMCKTSSVSDNLTQNDDELVCRYSSSPRVEDQDAHNYDHTSSASELGEDVDSTKKRLLKHNTLERLTCFHCGKMAKSETNLKTHMKYHHKQNIMVCRICDKRCAGRIGLTMHTNSQHSGEKAVECEHCGEQFFNSNQYNKHQTKVHGKERGICHVCGKHFRSSAALQAHIQVHLGVKQYVCEHCGKVFSRITSLITHRKLHLGSSKKKCCNICHRELNQGQCSDHPHPRKHNLSSGALNWLKCRDCDQTFDNMQALEQHTRRHEEDKTCVCNVCGKSFKMAHYLIVHKQQHREKRFHCDLCQKTFTYKCNMQKHRETHTQERAFECDICHKTFKTKGVMEKHKIIHNEALQFHCHLCNKGVITKHNLKKHYRKMHPGHPEAIL